MDFDVLIVGSGAGGGLTALRLCENGVKVGLIERGPRFDQKSDYILNYPDWESRLNPLEKARQKEQTVDQNYRTNHTENGRTKRRSSFDYHRVHGVGGSTLHYQGEAHRFAEHAFNTQTRFGWGLDWPIEYQDLAPYYQQVEQLLGVAGEPGNPFKPDREAFPTPAQPLSARSQLLAESAQRAGFTLQANTLALPSASVDGRKPCQHSGGCNFGCVFGAKSSVDQAIIPLAEKTGDLTLLTETQALGLTLDQLGEINGVRCISGGKKRILRAKRYVLAGGGLETPRLMLASKSEQHKHGYANARDQVGRYFMETVVARLRIEIAVGKQLYHGPPLDSRAWDFHLPTDEHTCGFVLGCAGYLTPSTGPASHALRTRGIGRAHKQRARETFGQTVYLFGVAEQEPRASNRLTLSDKQDRHGVPRLNVHCEYSKRDTHTIGIMHEKLNAWAHATPNANIRSRTDSRIRSAATHVGGSCRMGNDPSLSVVDAFGKVHHQNNCYITDASMLPTQGAGDSPSLTIQALALRTADRMIDDLKTQ